MTYNTARAPFLRRSDKLTHMTADVLITLVALCIFSAFYYGFRPVLLVLVGMATAMLCENHHLSAAAPQAVGDRRHGGGHPARSSA